MSELICSVRSFSDGRGLIELVKLEEHTAVFRVVVSGVNDVKAIKKSIRRSFGAGNIMNDRSSQDTNEIDITFRYHFRGVLKSKGKMLSAVRSKMTMTVRQGGVATN